MHNMLQHKLKGMFRSIICGATLFSIMLLLFACNHDYLEPASMVSEKEFRLSLGGSITRSAEGESIVEDMRLFCFNQAGNNSPGTRGNLLSPYHHIVAGLNRSGMVLTTQRMVVGKWDMAIVSPQGGTLNTPVMARPASEQLMYQYNPSVVNDKSSNAHQIYYRFLRLPEITADNHHTVNAGIARNMARVKIVVDRAVDVDVSSTAHTITLGKVPTKISWAGTLLKTVSPGMYVTDLENPDTELLTGKVSFTPSTEKGIFKSDTLEFIIPAHRSSDFWNEDGTTQNLTPKDTLKSKMNLSVSFAKPLGRGVFEKQNIEIPIVARCNETLVLQLKMNDLEVEVFPIIKPWGDVAVTGDISNPFLNVSELETTVYDGAASRLFFWSNQPSDSVYVMTEGKDQNDQPIIVNDVLDRLCGTTRANFSYKPAADGNGYEGYIDLANISNSARTSKIYLYAGGLKREITINSTITAHGAKEISTPYVGTFHRWNQRGERIVAWHYDGAWNARVEGSDNAAVSEVLIDRLASGAYRNNQLYSSNPGNAELYHVDDSGGSVSGNGRIYFRVGWKSNGNLSAPRYAKVVVRKGLVVGSGEVIQTLYIRQGEASDYVMRQSESGTSMNSRPLAARYTPYNITDPVMTGGSNVTDHKALPIYGGSFTAYPSQAGAFFQWARDPQDPLVRIAYHPVNVLGGLSGWKNDSPNQHWVDGSADNAICPEGYSRPHDGPKDYVDITDPQANASELKQSLWLQPQNGTASNVNNVIWGYYADGFFDRRELNPASSQGTGSKANIAVSWTNGSVAYAGNLFYNPVTNASLFFPAAGYRNNFNGAVTSAGDDGFFWTSTSYDKDIAWGLNTSYSSAKSSYYSRASAFNLRCVESPYYTITFYANGGSFSDGTTVKTIKITQGNSGYLLPQPANAPNGTGYAVWSTQASGSLSLDNTYSPQLKITPSEDRTYYASWSSSRLFFGHNGWAGSNVYWDGNILTFDNTGEGSEQRQGVYFMWGSLVALSPMGNPWNGNSMILHIPNTSQATNGNWDTANTAWGYIPRLGWQDDSGNNSSSNPENKGTALKLPTIQYAANQSYTYEHHDIQKNIGDICKYITDKGWAPGANENPRVEWRMPINTEFSPTDGVNYTKVNLPGIHQPSNNMDGIASYNMGLRKATESFGPGTPFFPASGYRDENSGSTTRYGAGYNPGQALGYWTGSQGKPQTTTSSQNGGALDYYNATIEQLSCDLGFPRNAGLTVRCVRVN